MAFWINSPLSSVPLARVCFGIPFFAKALSKVAASYGIKASFNSNLVAIDGPSKMATFEVTTAMATSSR